MLSHRIKAGAISKDHLFSPEDEQKFAEQDRARYTLLMSQQMVDSSHLLWPFVVDFKEDAYYHTLVEQAEFLLIISASTFVTNIASQFSVALIGVCIFMANILYKRPYAEDIFNTIEVCNDAIQMMILLIGLSYAFEDRPLDEATSGAFIVVLVVFSCCLLIYAVYHDIYIKC